MGLSIDRLSYDQLRFRKLCVAMNQVELRLLVTFCLLGFHFYVFSLVFDVFRVKSLSHQLVDWLENGIVVDFEILEDLIKVGLGLENIVVSRPDTCHGTLELGIVPLFEEIH